MTIHMRILIALILGIISLSISSFGQIKADSLQALHQKHLASLVLLKNEGNILPFQDLSAMSIAHLTIGDTKKNNEFDRQLKKYTTLKSFHLPLSATGKEAGEVYKYLINYSDLTIISVQGVADTANYSAVIKSFIADLSKRVDIVLTIFGQENLVTRFPSIEQAKAILYAKNNTAYVQSLAAQIHFGGIGANGQLSKAIGSYQIGDGISTTGGFRLKYGFPELVGVNGTYLQEKAKAIIQEGLDSAAFPGAQVLIAKGGQVVYQENFGYHTYAQKQAVRSTDIYDLASLTKVTTATPALMRLQDDGLFDIDAKLGDYFPDFKGSDKADLYFRSILAHHAQLKPYIVYYQKARRKNGKYRWRTFKNKAHKNYPIQITDNLYLHKKYKNKIMDFIKKSPLNKEAGYRYSGLSFLMYPDLVKAKTGQSFDQYLYQTFYQKIGANRLLFKPTQKIDIQEIIPTEEDNNYRHQLVHGTVHDEAAAMLDGISGNAGLFGNANDLAKLLQLYLNEGSYGGEQLIQKTTLQAFTQCQFCDEGNRRGLGFDKPPIEYEEGSGYIAKSASKYSYGHSGFTGTFFWIDPAEDLIVILLTNRVHPTRENRKLYTMKIRNRLHQAAYDAIDDFNRLKQEKANDKSAN